VTCEIDHNEAGAIPPELCRACMSHTPDSKPTTHQADLAKLPRALTPLIERPQWGIWRWTQLRNGKWQKPPFMATQPNRHVSASDPSTWCDYVTALAAVQAGHGDGISYVLTEDDPFAAIDIDNCRHAETHSIDPWAQLFMQYAVTSYQEVTPSGEGVRIWGLANGAALNRKFTLEINNKEIAVEYSAAPLRC
jgi:primase-polymerase (primpol)-like protein